MNAHSQADLVSELHRLLGRTVVASANLDLVVALALQAAASRAGAPMSSQAIDSLNTCKKLEALQAHLAKRPPSSTSSALLAPWFSQASELRQLRNSFVHGRWGIAPLSQEVCFVPAGLPLSASEAPPAECRYSLSELSDEVAKIETLAGEMVSLRLKHHF
ncbi:MAG: hypothetical protein ABI988_14445 [Nitrospirota bacterium]